MPNKLFEYISSGIPVIVSPLKEQARFVENLSIGFVADSHSPSSLASCILSSLSANLSHLDQSVHRACNQYSYKEQMVVYLSSFV